MHQYSIISILNYYESLYTVVLNYLQSYKLTGLERLDLRKALLCDLVMVTFSVACCCPGIVAAAAFTCHNWFVTIIYKVEIVSIAVLKRFYCTEITTTTPLLKCTVFLYSRFSHYPSVHITRDNTNTSPYIIQHTFNTGV